VENGVCGADAACDSSVHLTQHCTTLLCKPAGKPSVSTLPFNAVRQCMPPCCPSSNLAPHPVPSPTTPTHPCDVATPEGLSDAQRLQGGVERSRELHLKPGGRGGKGSGYRGIVKRSCKA